MYSSLQTHQSLSTESNNNNPCGYIQATLEYLATGYNCIEDSNLNATTLSHNEEIHNLYDTHYAGDDGCPVEIVNQSIDLGSTNSNGLQHEQQGYFHSINALSFLSDDIDPTNFLSSVSDINFSHTSLNVHPYMDEGPHRLTTSEATIDALLSLGRQGLLGTKTAHLSSLSSPGVKPIQKCKFRPKNKSLAIRLKPASKRAIKRLKEMERDVLTKEILLSLPQGEGLECRCIKGNKVYIAETFLFLTLHSVSNHVINVLFSYKR